MTTPMDALKKRLHATLSAWDASTPYEVMRRDWDALFGTQLQTARWERVCAGGVDAEWVAAPGAKPERVLLYLHGGGYVLGSVASHRGLIARLSAAAGCRALGINYRLAPEHPYPAAIEDATAAYHWLLEQGFEPRHIAIAGDSAGGGLAATTLLALKGEGTPLPAAAVLLSPWIDLEGAGASYESRKHVDPMVRRRQILVQREIYLAGKVGPQDPRVAPLHADLSGLPPLLIQVGDHESLLDDSRSLAERARAAGVDVTLEVWDGMIHVFQLFADELEEGRRAIEAIGAFVRSRMPSIPGGRSG